MRKFKKIARFIIELALSISIIVFFVINLLSSTILNEKYILDILEKEDYYGEIYKLIESNFKNYIQQSGLNEDILKNIVTQEQIKDDTKKIITQIYDGILEEISIQGIKEKLKNNIQKEVDIDSLNKDSKKSIDDFIEQISLEYKTTILNSEYEKQINTMYKKILKIINISKKVLITTIGILIVLLILLNLRRVYRIATGIGISLFVSGLFLIISNNYIKTKVKINYLTIINEPISNIVRNIANDVVSKVLFFGIIFVVLGFILNIVIIFIHNVLKYKNMMQNDVSKEK